MMDYPAGPPASITVPADEPAGGQDAEALLREALAKVAEARDAEPDDQDSLLMEKVTTLIQQILAGRAKEREAMMGSSPALKGLKRSGGY